MILDPKIKSEQELDLDVVLEVEITNTPEQDCLGTACEYDDWHNESSF